MADNHYVSNGEPYELYVAQDDKLILHEGDIKYTIVFKKRAVVVITRTVEGGSVATVEEKSDE